MSNFYVRIIRHGNDDSITYKGPLPRQQAEREAAAWRTEFPNYAVKLIESTPESRAAVRNWQRIVDKGERVYLNFPGTAFS